MDTEYQHIIDQIGSLKSEILQMDDKIRDYVADREKNPHPFPEDLVSKIRDFERTAFRTKNNEIQLRLDGLMNTLLVHNQYWIRSLEEMK